MNKIYLTIIVFVLVINACAPETSQIETPQSESIETVAPRATGVTEVAPSNPELKSDYIGLVYGDFGGGDKSGVIVSKDKIEANNQGYVVIGNYDPEYNVYYNLNDPNDLAGLGFDDEYLAKVFNAHQDSNGNLVGTLPDGSPIEFRNGFWVSERHGRSFYFNPKVSHLEGKPFGYPVLVENKLHTLFMGLVDGESVLVEGGRFLPAFVSPRTIVKNLGYQEELSILAMDGFGNIVAIDENNETSRINFLNPDALEITDFPQYPGTDVPVPTDPLYQAVHPEANAFFDLTDPDSPIVQFANALGIKPEDVATSLTPVIRTDINGNKMVMLVTTADSTSTTEFMEAGIPLLVAYEDEGYRWRISGLAELAALKNLTIGTEFNEALDAAVKNLKYSKTMERNFNVAVISRFSSKRIWRGPGQYDFGRLDHEVDYATQHGWRVRASHLVWGAIESDAIPDWLLNGNFTRDEYIQILEQHVKTIVGRYKGRVQEWSIANEAPGRSQWPGADFWNDKIGPEYIEMAFRWTREIDPDGILIFNDNNNEYPRDHDSRVVFARMYDTVKTLKEKGVPIDVVGMQMHLLLKYSSPVPPTKEGVVETMKKFSDLGVKIYITEFDVDLHNYPGTQEERLQFQANLYRDMMEACLESGICESFTTWGISDSTSWLTCQNEWCVNEPDADPLMFDREFNPKPAYFAMLDALMNSSP